MLTELGYTYAEIPLPHTSRSRIVGAVTARKPWQSLSTVSTSVDWMRWSSCQEGGVIFCMSFPPGLQRSGAGYTGLRRRGQPVAHTLPCRARFPMHQEASGDSVQI